MEQTKAEQFRILAIALAVLLAIAIPVQGWLGTDAMFKANETAKSAHVMIGNSLFLLAVGQLVLTFVFYRERARTSLDLVLVMILPVAIAGQMMLGFSGREDIDLRIWHIAIGVTLMGLTTMIATRAVTTRPTSNATS